MKSIRLDDQWTFRRGFADSLGMLNGIPGTGVDLPHDGMIGTEVSPDAPAKSDSGYFKGDATNYTRYVMIPKEWEHECVGLKLDGAMMNATLEINGCKAGSCHYGYAPWYADLTDYVTFGAENRITINLNPTMHVNSRWYTGSGLYRGVMSILPMTESLPVQKKWRTDTPSSDSAWKWRTPPRRKDWRRSVCASPGTEKRRRSGVSARSYRWVREQRKQPAFP